MEPASQKRSAEAAFDEHFEISDEEDVGPSQAKITKPTVKLTPEMIGERVRILVSIYFFVYIFISGISCVFNLLMLFFYFFFSFQNLIGMLNGAQKKPVLKIDRVMLNKWHPIVSVRLESWFDDKKKQQVHAVKLETAEFYFYLPLIQGEIFMRQVFGRSVDGVQIEKQDAILHGFNVKDNIWLLSDVLEFCIQDPNPSNGWEDEEAENRVHPDITALFPTFRVNFRTIDTSSTTSE